jgi:glycosyltransferase involved in cell wall biosynthesis
MSTPVKVAILDHTAKLGGGEIALLNLVSRLDRQRFDPLVILFSDGPLKSKLESAGVRVIVEPLDRRIADTRKDALGGKTLLRLLDVVRSLRFSWHLSRVLIREKVEIVHTNSLKADILGGIAGRIAGLPIIWHVRDRIEDDYLPTSVARIFRIAAKWLPDEIIANSASTLDTLRLPARMRGNAVYSGIELAGRARVVHDGTHWLDGDFTSTTSVAPIVGLVGRITPWKGQDVFIRAAKAIHQQFPHARFQIIGAALFDEQQYEQQCRQLVIDLQLDESVQFCGFRDNVPELVAAMDVLVHASTTGEPFGQVIVEGMAAGKPVVATNGGGVPEIVVDGVTGLLVPMGDADALASAVCSLLENPQKALAMGRAGFQRVHEHFTIERTVDRVQQIYDRLIPASHPSSRPPTSQSASTGTQSAVSPLS